MSTTTNRVAAALLRAGGDVGTAALLFERADLNYQTTLPHVVETKQARRLYKGNLYKVLVVANDVRSAPEVLAHFAKDTRVSVREALVLNPSLPHAALVALAPWALERKTMSLSMKLVERLSAEEFIDAISTVTERDRSQSYESRYPYASWFPGEEGAKLIHASGDKSLILKTARLGYPVLNAHLGALLVDTTDHVSLTEFMAAVPERQRPAVIAGISVFTSLLTVELATHLNDLVGEMPGHARLKDQPFALAEAGSLEHLALSSDPRLVRLAIQSGVNGSGLTTAIQTASTSTLLELTEKANGVVPGMFSPAQELALLTRFTQVGSGRHRSTLDQILSVLKERAPWPILAAALRHGSRETTCLWVLGGYPSNTPLPGQVLDLIDEPGTAFNQYPDHTTHEDKATSDRIHRITVIEQQLIGNQSIADDSIALLDDRIVDRLWSDDVARLVKPRLDRLFTTNTDAWDTFLGLVNGWDDTFSQLLSSVCTLHDIDPDANEVVVVQDEELFQSSFDFGS